MDIMVNRDDLEKYVVDGNEAVEMRLLHRPEDIEDEKAKSFHPEMCHQLFGEGESIFGYRDLKIRLYFGAASLETYVGHKYAEKISPKKAQGVAPDNVIEAISSKLPENDFHTNIDTFASKLESLERNFQPLGSMVHRFEDENDSNISYEIYQNDMNNPNYQKYHLRLESFVLWFIDAASYIDTDDDHWQSHILFEKRKDGGDVWYSFCGYCTVYKYWAYPDKLRPRVSQILILPPFQKKGLGTKLLQTVLNEYVNSSDVIDITFEDPSEELARIRDYLDCKNCQRLAAFHPVKLLKGFTQDMKTEAQSKHRITRRQARRVYEILRLKNTPMKNSAEYKKYRLDVKNRLNSAARQEQLNLEKAKKALKKETANFAELHSTLENRIEKLDLEFKELEKCYRRIIDRLDRDS